MATNRQYPDRPILGVGALIFRNGRILIIERARAPLKGYWSLPGGVVEVGESLEQAIRREIREETALEIELLQVLEIYERIMRDAEGRVEYHFVLIDYLCRAPNGEAQPQDDAANLAWASQEDLQNYQLTEGTLPVILTGFQAIS